MDIPKDKAGKRQSMDYKEYLALKIYWLKSSPQLCPSLRVRILRAIAMKEPQEKIRNDALCEMLRNL